MEETGIAVDAAALKNFARSSAKSRRLERECYELAGRSFNLNSPIQLRDILLTAQAPVKGLKKTKSGFSTDVDTLEKLAAAHPMPRKLIEYRSVAKLKSTYSDALGGLIDRPTAGIHTTFHQADRDRPVKLQRPESAKYPDPQRRWAPIRRAFVAERARCCYRRIIRRLTCGCWRICRKIQH